MFICFLGILEIFMCFKIKKKLSELNYLLHDIKDLKFSFVIYLILLSTKGKKNITSLEVLFLKDIFI